MHRTVPRRWVPLAAAAVLLVLAVAGPAAAHAGGTFPESGSEVQDRLQELYDLVGWMAIATSVIVGLLLAYVCVRFYAGPDASGRGEWFLHNTKLEITWTVGTLLVLVFLGVVTAQAMFDIESAPLAEGEDNVEVAIVGQQWQWTYLYPDGTTSTETLHLEANRTFEFYAVSCDVVHSVYIPNLGVKIDTTVLEPEECQRLKQDFEIPTDRRVSKFWLNAHEGTYNLNCAEFCGRGHAEMRGELVAFEPGSRDKPYGPPPDRGEVFHVEVTGSSEDPAIEPSEFPLNTGSLTTWVVHNNASGSQTLEIPEPYGVSTGSIPAGGSAEVQFTASTEGSFNVTVDGNPAGTLEVTSGERVTVELSDNPWYIRDGGTFEPGKAYAIKVWNNGSIPHNLYIGTYTPDRDSREAIFQTETYDADEFRWLNVTMPEEDATLDWWCDVPGHAEAGMLGPVTVGEGGEQADREGRNLIPGVGAAAAVLAAGAATWVRRRD